MLDHDFKVENEQNYVITPISAIRAIVVEEENGVWYVGNGFEDSFDKLTGPCLLMEEDELHYNLSASSEAELEELIRRHLPNLRKVGHPLDWDAMECEIEEEDDNSELIYIEYRTAWIDEEGKRQMRDRPAMRYETGFHLSRDQLKASM